MSKSFECLLVQQCAPTLAGVKPANLFSCRVDDMDGMSRCIADWNCKLASCGIEIRVLRVCRKNPLYLIYLYRRNWLDAILRQSEVQKFLEGEGYEVGQKTDLLLRQLSRRICTEREFPHEIGIFLGYPLRDVVGFIQNRGRNFTYSGCWKSYGDPVEAEARFRIYQICTSYYCKLFESGTPMLRLVVAA